MSRVQLPIRQSGRCTNPSLLRYEIEYDDNRNLQSEHYHTCIKKKTKRALKWLWISFFVQSLCTLMPCPKFFEALISFFVLLPKIVVTNSETNFEDGCAFGFQYYHPKARNLLFVIVCKPLFFSVYILCWYNFPFIISQKYFQKNIFQGFGHARFKCCSFKFFI